MRQSHQQLLSQGMAHTLSNKIISIWLTII
ncbi:MAG: hypothetical protein ACI30Y_01370 [Candidatus Limisoma sp.]